MTDLNQLTLEIVSRTFKSRWPSNSTRQSCEKCWKAEKDQWATGAQAIHFAKRNSERRLQTFSSEHQKRLVKNNLIYLQIFFLNKIYLKISFNKIYKSHRNAIFIFWTYKTCLNQFYKKFFLKNSKKNYKIFFANFK